MTICDMDCFNCKHDDCINNKVYSEKSRYCYRSEKQKQSQRDYSKKRYHEAKEKGLCVICKKCKATHGLKCYECYIRQKRLDKNKYAGNRESWRENGLCYFCGKPAIAGKKVCVDHYKTLKENIAVCNNHENTQRARETAKREMWGVK